MSRGGENGKKEEQEGKCELPSAVSHRAEATRVPHSKSDQWD